MHICIVAMRQQLKQRVMRFFVKFTNKHSYRVIDLPFLMGSLSMLDEIRELTGVRNLHPEKINECSSKCEKGLVVQLTEEQARMSGHFDHASMIYVEVPEKFLNRYFNVCYKVDRNQETGEINHVTPYYSLDNETLVESWLEAGSPLSWDEE